MARIELAPEVFDDFERFFDHLAQFEVMDAPERIEELVQALQILTHGPLIGRPVKGGKHELVIASRCTRPFEPCRPGKKTASTMSWSSGSHVLGVTWQTGQIETRLYQ